MDNKKAIEKIMKKQKSHGHALCLVWVTLVCWALVVVCMWTSFDKNIQENTEFIESLDKRCILWDNDHEDEGNIHISLERLQMLQYLMQFGLEGGSNIDGNYTIIDIFPYIDESGSENWYLEYSYNKSCKDPREVRWQSDLECGIIHEKIHFSNCIRYELIMDVPQAKKVYISPISGRGFNWVE